MKKLYTLITLLVVACMLPAQSVAGNWNSTKARIMIDPGHGGSDPGAGGTQGSVWEKTWALYAAKAIQSWINTKGGGTGNLKLTRSTDVDVSLSGRRSQSISYDPEIFCSIHLNAATAAAVGTETWYYFSGRCYTLATKVQPRLVAHLGRANRGVKQNGWTVITGSSSIPAVLTEGLFISNATEYNMLNSGYNSSTNTSSGLNKWVNGHLEGFYNFITSDSYGDSSLSPNPANNPYGGAATPVTPTKNPKIEASDLYFEWYQNEGYPSMDLVIKGTDLDNQIKVEGLTGSRFQLNDNAVSTPVTIAKTGGTVKVTFTPYGGKGEFEVGDYGSDDASATGNAYNFRIRMTSGSVTKDIKVRGKCKAAPLAPKEKWNISEAAGNKTSKGYDASNIRNFVYNDGKLYCVYNHKDILVLNAQTGAKLGYLKRGDIVKGGTLQLCDVKVIDGKVVACNLAVKGQELRVYAWENDNAEPTLLYNTTDLLNTNRLGDCIELSGSYAGTLRLTFGAGKDANGADLTQVIDFVRTDGTWSNESKQVITKYSTTTTKLSTQSTVRAYWQSNGYWVDGKDSYPTWATWDSGENKLVRGTYVDTGESWGSSHHEFHWGGAKYAANLVFNSKEYVSGTETLDKTANYKGGRMRICQDPTGDFTRMQQVGDYPEKGLGSTSQNTNATGDVMINTDETTYLEAWVLSTTHGIAYYTHGSVPAKTPAALELQEPQADTPVVKEPGITANPTSLSFSINESTTESKDVKVTGTELSGNITAWLEGDGADKFSISATSLPAAGGTVSVTYAPGTWIGNHSAVLKLAADGVPEVSVALNGTCIEIFSDDITADKITEKWISSVNKTNASWVDGSNANFRDIAVLNGKLYAVNATTSASRVDILDAYTGTKEGELDVSTCKLGTFKLGAVCRFDGKLIGSNIAKALKVYSWDNDKAAPVMIIDYTADDECGNSISASGTWQDGKIWIVLKGQHKVLCFAVKDGKAEATPTIIELKDSKGTALTALGADSRGAMRIHAEEDGTFWATAYTRNPIHYAADGTYKEEMQVAALGGKNYGTDFKAFKYGSKKLAVATTYVDQHKNGQLAVIDVTNGIAAATAPITVVPTDGLDTNGTGNVNRITAALYDFRHGGKTLDMWVGVSKQGVAHYSYMGGSTGVDDIAVDNDDAAEAEYYNLQGVRMDAENLQPGLYIKRQGKSATKVVVK